MAGKSSKSCGLLSTVTVTPVCLLVRVLPWSTFRGPCDCRTRHSSHIFSFLGDDRLDDDRLALRSLEYETMANKPLPALPSPALTTLSVDARNHRAQLIQHFFADIRIESRRDAWLHALEEALDDLSLHFSRGDWLSCIRRGRGLKQRTLSSNAVTDSDHIEGQHDKPLPESPDEPLKKLRLLITRSAPPPTEPRGGHLVLCLSPHRAPIPTDATGPDIVPANIGCNFSGGSFSLHQDESDSTVLYGLDGLEGNLPHFITGQLMV